MSLWMMWTLWNQGKNPGFTSNRLSALLINIQPGFKCKCLSHVLFCNLYKWGSKSSLSLSLVGFPQCRFHLSTSSPFVNFRSNLDWYSKFLTTHSALHTLCLPPQPPAPWSRRIGMFCLSALGKISCGGKHALMGVSLLFMLAIIAHPA
jgi:hypothetical protein